MNRHGVSHKSMLALALGTALVLLSPATALAQRGGGAAPAAAGTLAAVIPAVRSRAAAVVEPLFRAVLLRP